MLGRCWEVIRGVVRGVMNCYFKVIIEVLIKEGLIKVNMHPKWCITDNRFNMLLLFIFSNKWVKDYCAN